MNEIVVNNFTYRIKQMNAIELLALRSQLSFDSFDNAKHTYEVLLSYLEVNVKNQWLQVKQGNNYYPHNIENDIDSIQTLIQHITNYLKEVFHLSNASKTETE